MDSDITKECGFFDKLISLYLSVYKTFGFFKNSMDMQKRNVIPSQTKIELLLVEMTKVKQKEEKRIKKAILIGTLEEIINSES